MSSPSASTPTASPFTEALDLSIQKWNCSAGACWEISAKLDPARAVICAKIAESVFDGIKLPNLPGPFKRLAAFAVAAQYCSPYTLSKEGVLLSREEHAYWNPRLTIWTLPFLGGMLKLNGEPLQLPITFPTLHAQMEILNYLRNLFTSVHGASKIASDELLERIILVGLVLESSAYASFPDTQRLDGITKHAKACVDGYKADDPRWPDLYFMNADFLDTATSLGLD